MDRFLNFTLFIQKKKNRKNIKKMYFIVKKNKPTNTPRMMRDEREVIERARFETGYSARICYLYLLLLFTNTHTLVTYVRTQTLLATNNVEIQQNE